MNKPQDKQERKPASAETDKRGTSSKQDVPTDAEIANPVEGKDFARPPNDPEPVQESWPDKQARHARENEKAVGDGRPEPYPHD